jgi:hypothetical protein
MLLNEGVPPRSVITGIDDLINRLDLVKNSWARPDSGLLVQNSYLQNVEIAERYLTSWFEDDDGVTVGLYDGPHYRMIREMTPATPRPSPLIGDEVERQVKVLRRLQAKVREFLPMQERPGALAALDTNVLMHFHRFDKVTWAEVLSVTGQVRIILPMLVIDELDTKKYTGSDRMSKRADLAIRVLREYSADLGPGEFAELPDGTTLEVFLDEPGHVRKANFDDELLARCTLLKRMIERRLTIVTGDFGMQLRADAHGLGQVEMPAKYCKDAARRAAVEGD